MTSLNMSALDEDQKVGRMLHGLRSSVMTCVFKGHQASCGHAPQHLGFSLGNDICNAALLLSGMLLIQQAQESLLL